MYETLIHDPNFQPEGLAERRSRAQAARGRRVRYGRFGRRRPTLRPRAA